MGCSRDAARQADAAAASVLRAGGRSPAAMVLLFERLASDPRPVQVRQWGCVNAGQEPPLCDGEDADLSFHAGALRRIASRATDR